jgi:H+/Cl- antiporter ClcA
LADALCHRLGLARHLRRPVLAAGVAGGFGSVFGTPLAGAVFGLEFVVLGQIEYEALVPALVSALVGDMVTRSLGVVHTPYPELSATELSLTLLVKWVVFATCVAGASLLFIELTHRAKKWGELHLPRLPLRMLVGGSCVVALWKVSGTHDYLGLGVPTILRAFADPALPVQAFALKILFTAITLGAGFLGGEVTPLFFVGACLGNVLARILQIPLELGAGVGLAAVFACAANTPLALSIMAVEILGAHALPHVAVVCVLAYLVSGQRSIYPAQRVRREKGGAAVAGAPRLGELPGPNRDAQ